ncbi:sensor histidine kinase [Rhodomicrobium lacus]|uniref:sensor histidine kinase n=1 Tax=Rhodomicrobium lacus TaxID=2498452 RepID=UPI0026E2F4FB|nr:HAMP domain-containing sensor histidine kinase [Rhodomicrobium lacus]WKW50156.1 HAMP domain-containing sensor histidine kinase [Rhodomicrobium lacus]
MTILFVMVAEVLIFVPSVATFRKNWLMERVVAAKVAALALEASGGAELPERLRQELLTTAGVHAVSVRRPEVRRLVLGMPDEKPVAEVFDLRDRNVVQLIPDALAALIAPPGRLIRVIAAPDILRADEEIDVVIDETPLRAAEWRYARNIFWLSIIIAIMTSAAVYLALSRLLVAPMMRITRNMVSYRENPEDMTRIITPSGRDDEVGVAEKELANLQTQLSGLLREKARLANVGLAVSKINHDLRNILASAQLVSDRLATVPDPTVQRFVPRLIRALDRAIMLCTNTMKYGRGGETPPNRTRVALAPLVEEVTESLGVEELKSVRLIVDVSPKIELYADRDQIFRVLANLVRNAMEALREAEPVPEDPCVKISATQEGRRAVIKVSDNGPGVPAKAQENLFKAFQSVAKADGNGLGLVISAELVRAHGGDIRLEDSPKGASFVVTLPTAVGVKKRAFEKAA